jgi:beta-glucosidase
MKRLSLLAATLLSWALIPVVHTQQYTKELSRTQLESILNDMSLSDKIHHMAQIDFSMLFTNNKIDLDKIQYYFGELGIGSLLIVPYKQEYLTPSAYRSIMLSIQNVTKTYNRPRIIAGIDSVHGANYINGAIIFPQPINIACTWDESNARSVATFGAKETLAAGIPWMFSPIVGLGIEPSWSRMYETFGEDPYLVGVFARAMVEGIQQSGVAACGKHFVGYSAPRNGHDRSPSWIPTRHLYQYFVRPWREVIARGNVLTVMESYTEYDGVPNVANGNSLVTLLRQDLGFDGVVITDYQEIENLIGFHKVAMDYDEAVRMALMEGSVDMSMIPFNIDGWSNSMEHNFNDASIHDVIQQRIDDSVLRILQLKNKLGMFHSDLKEDDLEISKVGSKGRRAVALDIARESIVLTKNDGGTLPLHNSNRKKLKVHVTGPTCDSLSYQSGGWTIAWQGASDNFFEYGQTVLGAALGQSQWDVTTSCGVSILGDACDGDNQEIAKQQRLGSDYILVCVGEENYTGTYTILDIITDPFTTGSEQSTYDQ